MEKSACYEAYVLQDANVISGESQREAASEVVKIAEICVK